MKHAPGERRSVTADDTLRHQAYEAHPLLDPMLRRHRAALRFWMTVHREGRALEPTLHTAASSREPGPRPSTAQTAWYAAEADRYIASLLQDLNPAAALRLAPDDRVLTQASWQALLGMAFEAKSVRVR